MGKSPSQRILIAGAGPVGLTAAVEMMRRGFAPRVIDPDLAASPESRALGVNSRTLDLMEPSGVTERMLAAGHRVRRLVVRKNGRIIGRISMEHIPHRHNFLLVLAQSRSEEILEQRLAELGGKVERGTSLLSFAGEAPVSARLSDGRTIPADILLGADGAKSTVRKGLGLDFPGNTQEEQFGLCDVALEDWPFPFDTVVLTVFPTHLAPFIPMAEGYGRFITTQPFTREGLPQDARISRIDWQTDFRISFRQTATYQKGHVFLAGDAAHIHSPVGGRGMNLGMEDACWLAWLMAEGRLADYTRLRHPVGAAVLKLTHRFTALANANGTLRDATLATLLPLVSALPFLQRRLLQNLSALNTPPAPWL
jgi:2-polyprenyl-6-methoxyphenol hydroxylase-like FAD-dependent oxidoreductase